MMRTMSYIKHLTITTGSVQHSERGDVPPDMLAALAPWLAGAIDSGAIATLPAPFAPYGARGLVRQGCLMVTVHTPRVGSGPQLPLVTSGVARDAEQGAALWPLLLQGAKQGAGLHPPAAPWCAVHRHPAYAHIDDPAWLGDLERAVAWAWLAPGV